MTIETTIKQLTDIIQDIHKALGHQSKFNDTQFKVNETNIKTVKLLADKISSLEEKIIKLEEGRRYL